MNAATGWNLELDSVKVRVWPHAGLKLGSGRMTGLPPDSGVEEAGWQGGALRFSLLPLLRGRLEAASATLEAWIAGVVTETMPTPLPVAT